MVLIVNFTHIKTLISLKRKFNAAINYDDHVGHVGRVPLFGRLLWNPNIHSSSNVSGNGIQIKDFKIFKPLFSIHVESISLTKFRLILSIAIDFVISDLDITSDAVKLIFVEFQYLRELMNNQISSLSIRK